MPKSFQGNASRRQLNEVSALSAVIDNKATSKLHRLYEHYNYFNPDFQFNGLISTSNQTTKLKQDGWKLKVVRLELTGGYALQKTINWSGQVSFEQSPWAFPVDVRTITIRMSPTDPYWRTRGGCLVRMSI